MSGVSHALFINTLLTRLSQVLTLCGLEYHIFNVITLSGLHYHVHLILTLGCCGNVARVRKALFISYSCISYFGDACPNGHVHVLWTY